MRKNLSRTSTIAAVSLISLALTSVAFAAPPVLPPVPPTGPGIPVACGTPAQAHNPFCTGGGGGGGGGGGESKKVHKSRSSTTGKLIVGCIMGSALGAITASVRKASALGNPPRWRSQAEHEKIVASGYEKQFELTNKEAATSVALCGLGSLALRWEQKKPAVRKAVVVRARY